MQPGALQQGAPIPQASGQRQAPQRDFVRPETGYPAAGDRRTGPVPAATGGIFGGSDGPPAGATETSGGFRGADAAPAGPASASGTYLGAFVPSNGPPTTDDPGIYVYRDDGGPDEPVLAQAASATTADQDADYWYGPAEPEKPTQQQEVRGPFEPLRTGGAAGAEWAQPDAGRSDGAWAPAGQGGPGGRFPPVDETVDDEQDDDARHAQKLEQIKDFYMTAEAIGEENVDKHFDQLLAQQRDLLDQYFKDAKDRITAAAHDEEAPAETPASEGIPDSPAGTAQAGAASATTDW